MPDEAERGMSNLSEFLQRKVGPLPYWAWGLAGAAVIGGVIWMNGHGGLGALTGGDTGGGGGGEGAGGSIPPIDIPGNVSGPFNIPGNVSGPVVGMSEPLLIGQQSGATGGIIAPIFVGSGGYVAPVNPYVGTAARAPIGGPNISTRNTSGAPPGGTVPGAANAKFIAYLTQLDRSYAQGAATHAPIGGPNISTRRFSNPIPTTQTQVVQAPEPVNRRGGTQFVI